MATLKVKSDFTYVSETKDDKSFSYFVSAALGNQRIYINSATEYLEDVQLISGTVYSGSIFCNVFLSQSGSLITSALLVHLV